MDEHGHGGCGCGCGSHGGQFLKMDLGLDWAAAPDDEIVCGCAGVDKAAVVKAIEMGAYTLPLIKTLTGAGRGSDCEQTNPRGRCCRPDIEELIRIYAQDRPLGDPAGCQ
jgi:NAD(P)H-nitrite reductase large subunit